MSSKSDHITELCRELLYRSNSDNSLGLGLLGSTKAIKFLPVDARLLVFTATCETGARLVFQDYYEEGDRNRAN